MRIDKELHKKLSSVLRILSVEMVENANSGHPGMPMGFADVATVLYQHFLKFNPNNPTWGNRDRFILSAGHGSALLYSLLYLTGHKNYSLDDLKNFRKLHSITAGHPEYNPDLGVEITTGPLGQGLANGVGMAISQKMMNAKIGTACDHKIYVVVGDGCLMEGISHEAMSLAGHLGLDNIVVLFDSNKISIDGKVSIANSEMTLSRVSSYNWDVLSVDGHDPDAIYHSLKASRVNTRPLFIEYRTKIGYGSPKYEDSHESHGKSLGDDEIKAIRQKLNLEGKRFDVPEEILKEWRSVYLRNIEEYEIWNRENKSQYDKLISDIKNLDKVSDVIKSFKSKSIDHPVVEASRQSSKRVLSVLYDCNELIIGGSADLSESNGVKIANHQSLRSEDFNGNYIHYGIREHAMVAVMNGLKAHGGWSVYGGTFLVFADYCRPAIRLAALMKLPIVLVFTHDSIGVGEDGPTHQPIEHLSSLRIIPNLLVFRPADAIEVAESWEIALKQTETPSVLCLSRQKLQPVRSNAFELDVVHNLSSYGAYILYKSPSQFLVTIFATGSEVSVALNAAKLLEVQGIGAVVVSVICQELFWQQSMEYQMSILCNKSLKVAVEAGVQNSWDRFIGPHGMFFGVESYGESAPGDDLYEKYELTAEKVSAKIIQVINPSKTQ